MNLYSKHYPTRSAALLVILCGLYILLSAISAIAQTKTRTIVFRPSAFDCFAPQHLSKAKLVVWDFKSNGKYDLRNSFANIATTKTTNSEFKYARKNSFSLPAMKNQYSNRYYDQWLQQVRSDVVTFRHPQDVDFGNGYLTPVIRALAEIISNGDLSYQHQQ